MSQRVKRSELKAGRWYVVKQGSVMRPMRLDSWIDSTTVNMTTRQGQERKVSTLKIVEGWNPAIQQWKLLPKAGEPEKAIGDIQLSARARRGDPSTSVQAARRATKSCSPIAWLILEVLESGKPMTDEMIGRRVWKVRSTSSIRGRRSDLVNLGYVQRYDRAGKTEAGNTSTRWVITQSGKQAMKKRMVKQC